jgi:two-component system, cell cycle response regulator CtrA
LVEVKTEIEALRDLLDQSRRRLAQAQDAIGETLAALDQAAKSIANLSRADDPDAMAQMLEEHRDRLIEGVLAALDPAAVQSTRRLLGLDASGEHFRIGRRRLSLTASEQAILRLLWEKGATPVSREAIAEALYGSATIANPRGVDVFVSNLRRKLRIAGEGLEPIESVRGKGWRLVPELCEDQGEAAGRRGTRSA